MSWQIHDYRGLAVDLAEIAGVALARNEIERAGMLLGAAFRQLDSSPNFLAPTQICGYKKMVADVRAALGEAQFASLWEAGQALSLEGAVQMVEDWGS